MQTTIISKDYRCRIEAAVDPETAMKGIADVQHWWAKNFEGSAARAGDAFTVRFGPTFVTFLIAEMVPGRKAVWEVTDCFLHWQQDKTEWKHTKCVWELELSDGGVQINFTHVGLTPEVECYENCRKGWDQHIKGSLLSLLVNGKGMPA